MRTLAAPGSQVSLRSATFDVGRRALDVERLHSMKLPHQVPVMPLPGAVLFPHALLPLYIFEPRYREMLEHALHHHRMFCVTLIKPSCPEWHAPEDFFHLATAGLIRACVGRADGTSNLILQGLQRVRFAAFEQEMPFPIATIDPLESEVQSSVKTEALGAKVLELYDKFKGNGRHFPRKVARYLSDLSDPEMLAAASGYRPRIRAYSSIKYRSVIPAM